MATSLRGSINLRVFSEYNSGADLSTQTDIFDRIYPLTTAFADGTGDNQANVIWHDTRSVTAGSPDDIDVRTVTFMGVAQDFAEITGLLVYNRSTTTGQILQVGGDATAPIATLFGAVGDYINVHPSGTLILLSPLTGYAVTATTADVIQVASASGTISYDIWLIGRNS